MITKKTKNYCPDCGGAQVNHIFSYLSVLLGAFFEPWTNWVSKIIPESSFDWIGPPLVKILTFLKLGKITYKPEKDDSGRASVLWNEAIKRGINMYEFRLFGIGHDIFVSEYAGDRRSFDVLPRPKKYNSKGLEWMDDKGKLKNIFKKLE